MRVQGMSRRDVVLLFFERFHETFTRAFFSF